MREKTLSGFIIKYHSFLDGHKIVTVFTKEEGKRSVVVYGVRKPKSKHGSAFELLNEISLQVSSPKDKSSSLFTVRESSIIKSSHKLRESYENINNLYYLAEFISSFIQESSVDREVYLLLEETINIASVYPCALYVLTRSFELKSLSILGFLPDLKRCSSCGSFFSINNASLDAALFSKKSNHIKEGDRNIYLSNRSGWIFCFSCKDYLKDEHISIGAYRIILNLLNFSQEAVYKIKLSEAYRLELNRSFSKLISSIIGKAIFTKSDYLSKLF